MLRLHYLGFVLTCILGFVQGQTYPPNQSTSCYIVTDFNPFSPVYYNPTDTDDFGLYIQGEGGCTPGSYSHVTITTPSGATYDCGYAPLDGSNNLLSCANYPRGTAEEGAGSVNIDFGNGLGTFPLTITHQTATITAPTPTIQITTTPSTTITTTTTTTPTDTATSSQITVTSPSSTVTNTITSTPTSVKTTTTKTITRTIQFTVYQIAISYTTSTASCTKPSLHTCTPPHKRGGKPKAKRNYSGRFAKRDQPNNGEGFLGDAPPTTTPPVVTETDVEPTSTFTETDTAYAPDFTTTVGNPTPTSTLYTGTAVSNTTTTLAQVTMTRTKYAYTKTLTVVTKTITFLRVHTTTPACARTK